MKSMKDMKFKTLRKAVFFLDFMVFMPFMPFMVKFIFYHKSGFLVLHAKFLYSVTLQLEAHLLLS